MAKSVRCWAFTHGGEHLGDLHMDRVQVQDVKESQILIRVLAASINPIDIHRLTGLNPAKPFQQVIGFDFAGIVEECNENCRLCFKGQSVFGSVHRSGSDIDQQGSLQEFIVLNEDQVLPMPKNLTFDEAASVVVVASAAIQAFEKANLGPGETCLITGGSGGVGTMAIQIARKMFKAARVLTTVRSKNKVDICRFLGADEVIITEGDMWIMDQLCDVVLDCTGQGTQIRQAMERDDTRLISISTFDDPQIESISAKTGSRESAARLIPFLQSGEIIPVISKTFSFDKVPEALHCQQYEHPIGKIVVTFDWTGE